MLVCLVCTLVSVHPPSPTPFLIDANSSTQLSQDDPCPHHLKENVYGDSGSAVLFQSKKIRKEDISKKGTYIEPWSWAAHHDVPFIFINLFQRTWVWLMQLELGKYCLYFSTNINTICKCFLWLYTSLCILVVHECWSSLVYSQVYLHSFKAAGTNKPAKKNSNTPTLPHVPEMLEQEQRTYAVSLQRGRFHPVGQILEANGA